MGHGIVAAVADPHAHGAHVDEAAGVNDVVVRRDPTGAFILIGAAPAFADSNAARAEIVDACPNDAAIAASAAKPNAMRSDVRNLAVLNVDMAGAVGHHHGRDTEGRLGISMAVG